MPISIALPLIPSVRAETSPPRQILIYGRGQRDETCSVVGLYLKEKHGVFTMVYSEILSFCLLSQVLLLSLLSNDII